MTPACHLLAKAQAVLALKAISECLFQVRLLDNAYCPSRASWLPPRPNAVGACGLDGITQQSSIHLM